MKLSSLVNNFTYTKKMGRVILPIFFYLIVNCGGNNTKEINLFDGHIYLLKKGETEIEKNSTSINEAEELKQIFEKEELVLYKTISHKNYNTYLFIDLDSTILKDNIYKTVEKPNYTLVFYQHMVDSLSEITSITVLNNKSNFSRFSEDSLSKKRFAFKDLRNE